MFFQLKWLVDALPPGTDPLVVDLLHMLVGFHFLLLVAFIFIYLRSVKKQQLTSEDFESDELEVKKSKGSQVNQNNSKKNK
eukprot:403347428